MADLGETVVGAYEEVVTAYVVVIIIRRPM